MKNNDEIWSAGKRILEIFGLRRLSMNPDAKLTGTRASRHATLDMVKVRKNRAKAKAGRRQRVHQQMAARGKR